MNNGFTRKKQKRVLTASDGAVLTASDFSRNCRYCNNSAEP